MKIRVSMGVGSNPKLWAVADRNRQVGEFDLSDEPGRIVDNGICGMSGIIWRNGGHSADVIPRRVYDSREAWIADLKAEYPDAVIERADDEPLRFV